jgi:hypothetical protein
MQAIAGWATVPDDRDWGQHARVTPGWQRVRDAAVRAIESPRVCSPLVASAALQIDGWDRRVSNWARSHTPIFGSEQSAVDWSDHLRAVSGYAYYASVLATPTGDDPGQTGQVQKPSRSLSCPDARVDRERDHYDCGATQAAHRVSVHKSGQNFLYKPTLRPRGRICTDSGISPRCTLQ